MEDETTSPTTEIRKLRKKLRQIDNLEQIAATRTLTESETIKVNSKEDIRELLKSLIGNEEEVTGHVPEEQSSTDELNGVNEVECASSHDMEITDDHENKVEISQQKESDDGGLSEQTVAQENQTNGSEVCELEKSNQPSKRVSPKKAAKKGSKKVPKGWENRQFSVQLLEGHHHPVCAIDANEDVVVSGGYDSSVKVWDCKTGEEKYSLGGHVGCVTSILLLTWGQENGPKYVASGSLDCSVKVWNIEEGTMMKSLYVFSPVRCLAYGCDVLAVGNEGGKVQLINLDTNGTVFSTNCHDDAVTCIKFLPENRVATGSEDGEVKIFELKEGSLNQVFSTEDGIRAVNPSNANTSMESCNSDSSGQALRLRKINCLEVFEDSLIWGDDGFNLKVLNWKTGDVTKIRNNLLEFCPTEALAVLGNGSDNYLFSSGFDLDNGNSYINVRSLPSLDYVGTVSTSSPGHISSISALCLDETKVRLVTGGTELKIWNQVNRSKKRPADTMDDLIPCKYNCSYNTPRESEEDEVDDQSNTDVEEEEVEEPEAETATRSWCTIS